MAKGPEEPTDAIHETLAKQLFNLTWELLDKGERTPEEDERMLNAAHASLYHWGVVGEPLNWVRGEWQVSRVHSVLGLPEGAVHHGRRCLELCLAHGVGGLDLAFAYEALARGYSVAGDRGEADNYRELAREAGDAIEDLRDRGYFFSELGTVR